MTVYFPQPLSPAKVMATVGSYFSRSDVTKPKPIYAVLRVKGAAAGQMVTWSCSKRAARDALAKQWVPEDFAILRIDAVKA